MLPDLGVEMLQHAPIGFWSYARRDDELSDDNLTRLRELIKRELQLQFGRDDITLFQDTTTIPHGAEWERETFEALGKSTFFIPIITPNFIQSEWCAREIAFFLDREKELQTLYPGLSSRSRIFPISYRKIRDRAAYDPDILEALRKRQWCNFEELRHEEYHAKLVKAKIAEFAESICDLLTSEIEAPRGRAEVTRTRADGGAWDGGDKSRQSPERPSRGTPVHSAMHRAVEKGRTALSGYFRWWITGLDRGLLLSFLVGVATFHFLSGFALRFFDILSVPVATAPIAFMLPAAIYLLVHRKILLPLYLLVSPCLSYFWAVSAGFQTYFDSGIGEPGGTLRLFAAGAVGGAIVSSLSFVGPPLIQKAARSGRAIGAAVLGTLGLSIGAGLNNMGQSAYMPVGLAVFALCLATQIGPLDRKG